MSINGKSPAALAPGWPEVPADDPIVESARRFVVNIQAAANRRSRESVSAQAGMNAKRFNEIIDGTRWADLNDIARLEIALGEQLTVSAHEVRAAATQEP